MAKRKAKEQIIDGLGPKDLKRIASAVRQAWQWSASWRIAKARALHADGFFRCENKKCPQKGKPVPKVSVDHIEAVGRVTDPNYIKRMFIPSKFLQVWCKKCHDAKTRIDNELTKGKDVSFL
jgi:hypothetical protein